MNLYHLENNQNNNKNNNNSSNYYVLRPLGADKNFLLPRDCLDTTQLSRNVKEHLVES